MLSGNAGSNRLIGGDGVDTVQFQGPIRIRHPEQCQWVHSFDDDLTRDGADEIIEFEFVEFSDGTVEIDALLGASQCWLKRYLSVIMA